MKNSTDLSVIIPTFNNVKFIDDCLSSVLKSGENYNIEILVGVDACLETLSHIKQINYSPLIKFYLFNENSGPYIIKNTLSLKSNSNNLLFVYCEKKGRLISFNFSNNYIISDYSILDKLNQSKKINYSFEIIQ